MLGHDPEKGAYVSTWIDSVSPTLMVSEGSLSKDGKVLTCTSTRAAPEGPIHFEHVTTIRDERTRVFELQEVRPDGKRVTGLKITYTRVE